MLHCFGQKPRAVMQSTMFFYFSLLFIIFLFYIEHSAFGAELSKALITFGVRI